MPELPEVETIRRDLEKTLSGCTINKVSILGKSSIRHNSLWFSKKLEKSQITQVNRRAKLLMIELDTQFTLLVHLKMTGQLIHVGRKRVLAGAWSLSRLENGLAFETVESSENRVSPQELPNQWTRVVIEFDDQTTLYFNDIRRFGYLQLVDQKEKANIMSSYGIEPLTGDYTFEAFSSIFKKRTAPVKSILLNQKLIAGVGNIYADEMCFAAGVRPTRRAQRVTQKEQKKLFKAGEVILKKAIDHRGTSFRDYVSSDGQQGSFKSLLNVYGRDGQQCFNCSHTIKKIKLSGRGTHYCPACQK